MYELSNRCTKCLIPIDTKGIEFTKDGVCQLCMEHDESKQYHPTEGAFPAEKIVREIKKRGAGKPYDCVVGFSGGSDSTYLLYQLVKKHDLRCIVAYYRTPFTPDTIDKNVKKIRCLLNTPLVEIKLPKDRHESIARKFVLKWRKNKELIMANLACAPCKLLNRELFAIASNYNIPTIVHGDNKYEHANIAAGQFSTNKRDRYALFSNVLRVFLITKKGLLFLLKHPGIVFNIRLIFKAAILYLNPYTAYLRLRHPKIFVLNYFDHAEWSELELNEALNELGWVLPDGCYSAKKADCEFAEIKNIMFKDAVGATYNDFLFSNLVRHGKLNKEKAIERYDKEARLSMLRLKKACKVLNICHHLFEIEPQD